MTPTMRHVTRIEFVESREIVITFDNARVITLYVASPWLYAMDVPAKSVISIYQFNQELYSYQEAEQRGHFKRITNPHSVTFTRVDGGGVAEVAA